jgi:hypothetical protein
MDALNPTFSSQDGVLFSKNLETLIQCPGGKAGGYTIPDSVTSIRSLAFLGCTGLISIMIPNSVTSFEYGTFSGCTGLTSVTIPNNVTSIGDWAFSDCTRLTSITIPHSVTSIEYGTFSGCTGLTSITIPNNVTSIGDWAFSDCTSLTAVHFQGNAPVNSTGTEFAGADQVIVYYLPGSTGWGTSYGGRPTALWIPLSLGEPPLTTSSPLKLLTRSPAPATVRVQRSADLRDWEDWRTVSRDQGPGELHDPDVSTTPYRFYRLVEN